MSPLPSYLTMADPWQPLIAGIAERHHAGTWQPNTTYAYPNEITVTIDGLPGFLFQINQAGTSGATEPDWPTLQDELIVDGTVTWRCHLAPWLDASPIRADRLSRLHNDLENLIPSYINEDTGAFWTLPTILTHLGFGSYWTPHTDRHLVRPIHFNEVDAVTKELRWLYIPMADDPGNPSTGGGGNGSGEIWSDAWAAAIADWPDGGSPDYKWRGTGHGKTGSYSAFVQWSIMYQQLNQLGLATVNGIRATFFWCGAPEPDEYWTATALYSQVQLRTSGGILLCTAAGAMPPATEIETIDPARWNLMGLVKFHSSDTTLDNFKPATPGNAEIGHTYRGIEFSEPRIFVQPPYTYM